MKYFKNIDSTTLKGLCNLTTENHFNFNEKYFLTGFLSSTKSSFSQEYEISNEKIKYFSMT